MIPALPAGPPDAPLDVQLEHGPSPGIAVISWLPVTIDASGTSNGVRVTGYTIYADKRKARVCLLNHRFSLCFRFAVRISTLSRYPRDVYTLLLSKVLEVSSPTAGSALLGPSQIQSLQSAQELTVRTMSAHGESCDSFPVSVPSKLAAIMAGPPVTNPVVPPLACSPIGSSKPPMPSSNGNSAAKVSVLPCSLPLEMHACGLSVEAAANHPHTLHSETLHSSASYVKAWANPSSPAALAVCEATLPVCTITPVVIPNLIT